MDHANPRVRDEHFSQRRTTSTKAQPQYEYHFVKTYGWYETEQTLFVAMEYIALGDLQSHLVDAGPFKEVDVKFISKQVLHGLQFMHEEDFYHGDLKPSNLLIKQMPPNGPWWVKISVFGLSKILEQSRGTLGFKAPELLGYSKSVDQLSQLSQLDKWKAADIWAFGETMYRLLTGVASFGDNIRNLSEYCEDDKNFPRRALKRNKVSVEGIEFIRRCMAPCPTDRPSANAALERLGWPMNHCKNGYRNLTTKFTHTLSCQGKQPPFILFTPEGKHIIIIETGRVRAWDIESKAVVESYDVTDTSAEFCHGSIHPDGSYLCVTQTQRRKPLILRGPIDFQYAFRVDDNLDEGGSHPTISTFSPDGGTLVTARNDLLCRIDIDHDWHAMNWTATNQYCVVEKANPNRDKCENRIEELRFTKDGSQLIAACHSHVVIMNTKTDNWFKKQVIRYPCRASGLDISTVSGDMVACGSTTGELWLWTSDMGCWVRRMKPDDHPGATFRPVENVRFSASGKSILYNYRGGCGVNMCGSVPLDRVSFAHELGNHLWRRMGHTITNLSRGIGATALGGFAIGGARDAEIILWNFEL